MRNDLIGADKLLPSLISHAYSYQFVTGVHFL